MSVGGLKLLNPAVLISRNLWGNATFPGLFALYKDDTPVLQHRG